MARYIRVSENGYLWKVPVRAIPITRSVSYINNVDGFQPEYYYHELDSYETVEWMQNNIDWNDYLEYEKLLEKPDKIKPSILADYEIMEE